MKIKYTTIIILVLVIVFIVLLYYYFFVKPKNDKSDAVTNPEKKGDNIPVNPISLIVGTTIYAGDSIDGFDSCDFGSNLVKYSFNIGDKIGNFLGYSGNCISVKVPLNHTIFGINTGISSGTDTVYISKTAKITT